ncbi:hypothetical protein EB796_015985 [Bugula neritina]|uniref:Uncharacterized protein n=1 Tax=Bugula neritina TaxID=10212 RepID=A0A7J7JJD8_BUGNE|nr:hypothetical protein EB796_015985 [Bugula neritina]
MTEDGFRLVHKCELEYVEVSKSPKPKVTVELFMHKDQAKGAAIVKNVKFKNKHRLCLVLLWKDCEGNGWRHLVLRDKDKPASFNCVKQLKSQLTKLSHNFQLRSEDGDSSACELQIWGHYIALSQDDGLRDELDESSVPHFCSAFPQEHIFRRFAQQVKIVWNESSPPDCITLQTPHSQPFNYRLSNGDRYEIQQLMSPSFPPLPPTPVEINDCGQPPGLSDPPFWFYEAEGGESIYDHVDDEYSDIVKSYKLKQIVRKEISPRFKNFVDSVYIKPGMLELAKPTPRQRRRVYDRPCVSVFFNQPDLVQPETLDIAPEYPNDNVERTFGEFLKKILKYTFNPDAEPDCPLGMTREEREKFCFQLHLNEFDIIQGPGWKTFTNKVMHIGAEDIKMIDEFSMRYKCQVVEVVLDHWYKLDNMKSYKSKVPACKQSIIEVLKEMERFNLLSLLHWDE